nr:TPA_inf: conotoxin precursor Q [Conus judaeus]
MSTLGMLLLIALLLPLTNPADTEDGQAKPRSRKLRSLDFERTSMRLDKRNCDPTDGCQTTVCETDTGPCCCQHDYNCQDTDKFGPACVRVCPNNCPP